jgi:hypothetical protein
MKAFEETLCAECNKPIPKGDPSYWVDDLNTGKCHMLHVVCMEGL